jgi:hypothetical protein
MEEMTFRNLEPIATIIRLELNTNTKQIPFTKAASPNDNG